MGTTAKRITRNRIVKGMKQGKGKVKRVKEEEVNDDEKNIQCSSTFPSDPAAQSRKRTQKSVNKKMRVKKEFHNSIAQNAAPAAVGSETTVKKKAMLIAEFLDRIYPYPPVPLNHYDTFTLLVAVILSAQTTDGKVVSSSRLFTLTPFCIFLSNCCAHTLHLLLSAVSLLVSRKYRLML